MTAVDLFPREQVVGVFRGFREGGLEFHADLVLPYRNDFQNIPMHGQFLLVQLETPNEAVLGRIASFSSEGKLSSPTGEEFNIRAVQENRPIPEDIRERYLKYRVNIRVLGVIRNGPDGILTFVPSHRRLPHVGSAVAFPSENVLKEIAGHYVAGAALGHLALGEYIYADKSSQMEAEPWMQIKNPEVLVRFSVDGLVSRRSFVFARAGFGKSNLTKLLFSKLYEETPTIEKRGGRRVKVGTVIFDRDGEYFWPDDKGRPGFCDVPHLVDKLVVFTSRKAPSDYYQSFVAGAIKLDIRRLQPADVIAIALDPERQEQQNVRKLRGLSQERWVNLVNLVDQNGHETSLEDISDILQLDPDRQQTEALAARSNTTAIVRMLHDRSSQLMDMLVTALQCGKLCVVDVSQMPGGQALILSGLILRRIFDRNQQEFTAAEPKTIPTIAVIEEAQSVLNERSSAAQPYIAWVKEGRKYDLGAVLITQQPGSIPAEILSQGDNWFIFHLLSAADLTNVRRANAHFSEDLLSSLLNEPIPGQGVFWSSASGKPYPISLRILSFEKLCQLADPAYSSSEADTFARKLQAEFRETERQAAAFAQPSLLVGHKGTNGSDGKAVISQGEAVVDQEFEPIDIMAGLENKTIRAFCDNSELLGQITRDGVPWGRILAYLVDQLPSTLEDRRELAHRLVPRALTEAFGRQNEGWHSYKHPERQKTYVKAGPR